MSSSLCYNSSWYKSNSAYTQLGEYSTDEDVGATLDGNNFTITGLNTDSVYWLQVTVADGNSENVNAINLHGLTEIDSSKSYSAGVYWSTLSGFFKVTDNPVVTTSGTAGSTVDQRRLTSILIVEADVS